MRVSELTMLFIAVSMLVSVAIPVGLCIFCRKKWKCDFLPFWVGCGVMFLFAFVLEQGVHAVVLSSAAGNAIKGNLWLYALYGGLMAGLFEETGRLTAMKFLLKKNRGNSHNALMYGAGHGGFEAFFILFFAMLNNLIYSVMINSGNARLLLQELDAANAAILQSAFDTLANASPFLFLAGAFERVCAVVAQLALSVLVWQAASGKGKIGWYFLAVFLHFALDAAAVLLSGYGLSAVVIELVVCVVAVGYALLAWRVFQKSRAAG